MAPRIPLPSPATQATPQTGSFRGKRRESPQNNGFHSNLNAADEFGAQRVPALPTPRHGGQRRLPQGRGRLRALTGQRRPPGCQSRAPSPHTGNPSGLPRSVRPSLSAQGRPRGFGASAPGRVAAVGLQVPWRPAAAGGAGGGRGAAPWRRRGQLYPGLWRSPFLSRRRPLRGGGSMCARRGAAPVPAPRLLLFPPPPWTPTPSSRPCGVPWIRRCGKPPRGSLTR